MGSATHKLPDYFEMTLSDRADCIADCWLLANNGAARGGARWKRIRACAERHLREALAQHDAEMTDV